MKKNIKTFLFPLLLLGALMTFGCAQTNTHHDEQEYSDMPWNTPQQWEGSQSLPGMTPGY